MKELTGDNVVQDMVIETTDSNMYFVLAYDAGGCSEMTDKELLMYQCIGAKKIYYALLNKFEDMKEV